MKKTYIEPTLIMVVIKAKAPMLLSASPVGDGMIDTSQELDPSEGGVGSRFSDFDEDEY